MEHEVQQVAIKYIGMLLSHKNCQLDLKEYKPQVIEGFEKINLQSGFIITRYTEAVIKLLEEDMKDLQTKYRLSVKVSEKSPEWRIYKYRSRYGSGTIRITNQRLLELTKSTSAHYFSDKRVKVEPKPWY